MTQKILCNLILPDINCGLCGADVPEYAQYTPLGFCSTGNHMESNVKSLCGSEMVFKLNCWKSRGQVPQGWRRRCWRQTGRKHIQDMMRLTGTKFTQIRCFCLSMRGIVSAQKVT